MITNIDWLFAESTSELSHIRYCCGIQSPKPVFIECLYTLRHANLDAVGQ